MKNSSDYGLYFIAIIPPDPILTDAQNWKEHFAKIYNSKASMNSAPHITLHMPFKFKLSKEQLLIDGLAIVGTVSKSFNLELNGFGTFAPKTIFMKVLGSPVLKKLHGDIKVVMKTKFNIFNADYRDHPFHPHLTLAFRDLKKANFELAWDEFESKSYKKDFAVNEFWLLKHDGKRWQKFQQISLLS